MKLVSVNTGSVRRVRQEGRTVSTGIYKHPVDRRIRLGASGLEGDAQADTKRHGGADMAAYAYPAEHYRYWRVELAGIELPWGIFGENLTTEGLAEETVHIGDRFRIGDAELIVTQPRLPCFKLGIRFGRPDIVRRFLESGRTGFYFKIAVEGKIGKGDRISLIAADPARVSVAQIVSLVAGERMDTDLVFRAARHEALPAEWRRRILRRLEGPPV